MKQLVDQTRSLVGLTLSPQQIALLGEYEKELQIWNQRISLTAIDESQQIRTKHFLDSFSSLLVMTSSLTTATIVSTLSRWEGGESAAVAVGVRFSNKQLRIIERSISGKFILIG